MKARWFVIPCLALVCAPLAARNVYFANDAYYHKDKKCPKLSGSTVGQGSKEHARDVEHKTPCPSCHP